MMTSAFRMRQMLSAAREPEKRLRSWKVKYLETILCYQEWCVDCRRERQEMVSRRKQAITTLSPRMALLR